MTSPGVCIVRLVDGRPVVDRADPFVDISRELLLAVESEHAHAHVEGDVFVIDVDPPVRYRLHDRGDRYSVRGVRIDP